MGSTHIKALRSVQGATLAGVVSGDAKKLDGDLSAIQGNLGGPGEKLDFTGVKKFTRAEDAIADPDIDAVDLCVPTDLHMPLAVAALRAGKHVMVEKPMALDPAQCELMIREAESSDRILMTAQVLRFFPAYTVLRDQLQSGALGPVRAAMFRRRCAAPAWSQWLQDSSKSGGGVFDLLIHDVDMCLHLFGKPIKVTASGFEDLSAGIDIITARFHYENIPSVIVTGGWHHPKSYPFSMEYTVSTQGGTIDYSSLGRDPELFKADGESEKLNLPDIDGYAAELQYFTDCCTNNRQPRICSPEDSAESVRLAHAMLSARQWA